MRTVLRWLRSALGLRPRHGSQHERAISTRKGVVEFLADVEIDGDRLTLADVCIYPQASAVPLDGLTRELVAAKNELVRDARRWGFKELRIVGTRAPNSTAATPGRQVDILILLDDEKEGDG